MTDRELLEKAAIAADMDYDPESAWPWNPLEDDGQALRLAVNLRIAVTYPEDEDCVRVWYGDIGTEPLYEALGTDPYAATRRAIVRAAAAIGETHGR